MVGDIKAVEVRAEVRQVKTMVDGTINITLNLPEDCRCGSIAGKATPDTTVDWGNLRGEGGTRMSISTYSSSAVERGKRARAAMVAGSARGRLVQRRLKKPEFSGARDELTGLSGVGVDDPLVDIAIPAHVEQIDDANNAASPEHLWGKIGVLLPEAVEAFGAALAEVKTQGG
jgi:hypothetical protein